jgi:hypothetical protein
MYYLGNILPGCFTTHGFFDFQHMPNTGQGRDTDNREVASLAWLSCPGYTWVKSMVVMVESSAESK